MAEQSFYHRTEMWIVLIVGCVPPIRPLFVKLFRKVSSTASRTYNQTSRSGTELRDLSSKRRFHEIVCEDGSEQNILIETNINLAFEEGSPEANDSKGQQHHGA